ncbi:MAG: hypothetical protein JOZ02_08090 [Acidobacteria bacterium]|nr:hypothetical protein [Acidobacteriota bacterium]
MQENRVSAVLGEAERQAVFAAIETIRKKLPFLIDLTPEERRALPRYGDKSRGFIEQALQVAEQNPGVLPSTFDVGEMRNDLELLTALSSVQTGLAQLMELVDDTVLAAGSDAYAAALIVYQFARAAGKGSALDAALEGLAQHFARKSRSKPAPKS